MTSGAFRLCRCGVLHQAGIITKVDAGGSVDPFGAARRLAAAGQPLCESFRGQRCAGPCGPGARQPLNAQVAIALGFTVRNDTQPCLAQCVGRVLDGAEFPIPGDRRPHFHGGWTFWVPPEWELEGEWRPVPNYPEDWSVTGPLVERFQIELRYWPTTGWSACLNGHYGVSEIGDYDGEASYARTPLIAICDFLLMLSAVGKLRTEKGKVVSGDGD